jgi:hypothetical protein
VLKRNEDGEITSTDGVGNNLAGVIISEGVDKNAGVDTMMSTVASPLKSRMGDMGVLEEVIKLREEGVKRVK